MKNICIFTSARSEYGLLRWVIDGVYRDADMKLQLIVAGGHLSAEQGYTYKFIENDGYPIEAKIEMLLASDTESSICKSMGLCQLSISDIFKQLSPDILIVLGDRYELLPVCSAALIYNIPIAHISGGDITEGAIDNCIRNAVTQMSTYHFPGTKESAERIVRMIGSSSNVYVTGETNLDNFRLLPRLSRTQLADELHISLNKPWVLCTYHSETKLSIDENMERVSALFELFSNELKDCEVIVTKSNADFGGIQINNAIAQFCTNHLNVHLYDSLGISRYIGILYQVLFMIGNSSSGIFESPVVGVPVINMGERQKGRLLTTNIISTDGSYAQIKKASEEILERNTLEYKTVDNPYGDGCASKRIVEILKQLI